VTQSRARHRFRRVVLAALVAVLAATLVTVPAVGAWARAARASARTAVIPPTIRRMMAG